MLLNIYRSIKTEYLNRSPRGKWHFVRKMGSNCLCLLGVPLMQTSSITSIHPSFKPYWYSYSGVMVVICITFSHIYTWWFYYHSDDPLKAFLIVPLYGTIVPVNFLKYTPKINIKLIFRKINFQTILNSR